MVKFRFKKMLILVSIIKKNTLNLKKKKNNFLHPSYIELDANIKIACENRNYLQQEKIAEWGAEEDRI